VSPGGLAVIRGIVQHRPNGALDGGEPRGQGHGGGPREQELWWHERRLFLSSKSKECWCFPFGDGDGSRVL
jgi:hypothetical protein